MSDRGRAGVTACVGLLLAGAVAWPAEAPQAAGTGNRRKQAASHAVTAQGGAGIAPVAGAPSPAPPGPLSSRPIAVRIAPPTRSAVRPVPAFTALALEEGEGTLEIAGATQTVKPGERLGRDTVRSIAPGQIVLERAATTAGAAPVLVIVTFDRSGRPHARTIHSRDETAPVAPEVKRP